MITTRREFTKIGLGIAALSTGVTTAFGSNSPSDTSSDNIIPPDEWTGGRRVGVRINGAYWGGGYEQIDMLSGNLNFAIPLVLPNSRGAFARILCSYNSQMWERKRGSKERACCVDTGYGHGWSVCIGSIVPKYSKTKITGYTYIDETGAEYPLSLSNGIWISQQGKYVAYDPATARLQFPNGSWWILESESAAGEPDAGTLYPTLIQDRNGNQIVVRYMNGAGSVNENTSSRITEIIDARAVDSESGRKTYSFLYDTGAMPRLLAINSHIGNSESWSFSYESQRLTSPFNASGDCGVVSALKSIRTAAGFDYTFEYNTHGELHYAHMPYGARFRWEYADVRDGIRGVKERGLMLSLNAKEAVYDIRMSQNDGTVYTVLTEPEGMATRIWTFTPDGLLNTVDERTGGADKSLRRVTHKWKSTSSGVPYICATTITLDPDSPDEKSSRDEYDRDLFGNLTESRKYDYDNPTKPISVVRNTYLTDAAYIERGIYNLLLTTIVSNGEETIERVRNQYDTTHLVDLQDVSEHDPQYDASLTVRGNLTESIVGEVYTRMKYDITGLIDISEDGAYNQTPYADRKVETNYDSIGRMVSVTNLDGGKTEFKYEGNAVIEITDRKYKKTVYDDFHRLCMVETGAIDDDGTISVVEYEYGAVPGSPLGACLRASIPYAPGAKPAWVSYKYDSIGRLIVSDKVGHGGKESYVYKGNDITLVNARSGWKTFSHDAKLQLRKVTTPDAVGKGKNETLYKYDTLGKLKSATLSRPEGTQKHTFKYDGGGRLLIGNRAESGHEEMIYNADGTLATRTDAKGQRTAYSYDSLKRLVSVKRFGVNGQVKPEECGSYYYDRNPFDAGFSQNTEGRLVAAQWGDTNIGPGLLTEMYSYTASGRITQKRLRVNRGNGNVDLDLGYSYDDEGRVTGISYPNGGPTLNYSYDAMGRQNLLTTATDVLVKDVSYSVQGHLTSFSQLIPETDEYLIETHEVSSTCHTNSVVAKTEKAALPLVNIEYNYYEDGKLESGIDRLSGEETRYEYDTAGRLKTAKSPNRNWELDYDYDGFGNLSSHKRKNRGRNGKDFELKHNPATNRMETPSVEYDANGNIVSITGMELTYDVENRLVVLRHNERGVEQYAYDFANRRIWKKQPDGVEEFYLYGENSRPLAVYRLTEKENNLEFEIVDYSVYFANRLIRSRDRAVVLNRQHSVETEVGRNGNLKTIFLPFGEEDSATEENRVKFGMYRRDATSGLDYAEQRYYSSALGRFITPDPYVKSINPGDPETWNRYAYCGNDPINCIDPHGTNCTNVYVGNPWINCGQYYCPSYTDINDPMWIYYHPTYGYCAYGSDETESAIITAEHINSTQETKVIPPSRWKFIKGFYHTLQSDDFLKFLKIVGELAATATKIISLIRTNI